MTVKTLVIGPSGGDDRAGRDRCGHVFHEPGQGYVPAGRPCREGGERSHKPRTLWQDCLGSATRRWHAGIQSRGGERHRAGGLPPRRGQARDRDLRRPRLPVERGLAGTRALRIEEELLYTTISADRDCRRGR